LSNEYHLLNSIDYIFGGVHSVAVENVPLTCRRIKAV